MSFFQVSKCFMIHLIAYAISMHVETIVLILKPFWTTKRTLLNHLSYQNSLIKPKLFSEEEYKSFVLSEK